MREAVQALPTSTDDIREIVVSGIPVHGTSGFETVENPVLEDGCDDESQLRSECCSHTTRAFAGRRNTADFELGVEQA